MNDSIVLLPGMDGTGFLFEALVEALGKDVETVVVSYPGDRMLGYSDLEAIARSHLPKGRPYVLVGESFSGPIAISIAASAPERLRGLVLSCSFARNPRRSLAALKPLLAWAPERRAPAIVAERILLGRFATAPLRAALARAQAAVTPAVLKARLRSVMEVDVTEALARVRVPTLYLRATEDRVVPKSAAALVARTLPAARIVEIVAPHLLLQAAARAAAARIRAFARECGAALQQA